VQYALIHFAEEPPTELLRCAVRSIEKNNGFWIGKGSLGGREIDAMTSDIKPLRSLARSQENRTKESYARLLEKQ
jgi:hypothetical protein